MELNFDDGCDVRVLLQSRFVDAPGAPRITTFGLTYPLAIHAQVLTHRRFARSASSKRAIPIKTMIERVRSRAWRPAVWFERQSGMQPKDTEIADREIANEVWANLAEASLAASQRLEELGVAKELANATTGLFQFIDVVLTCRTDDVHWDGKEGFLEQRALHSSGAQSQFQTLARRMRDAVEAAETGQLSAGDWHAPLAGDECEWSDVINNPLQYTQHKDLLVSAGRCARWSYGEPIGSESIVSSAGRAKRMLDQSVRHLSPFEHQVTYPLRKLENKPAGVGLFTDCGLEQLRHVIQYTDDWSKHV